MKDHERIEEMVGMMSGKPPKSKKKKIEPEDENDEDEDEAEEMEEEKKPKKGLFGRAGKGIHIMIALGKKGK